MRFVEWVKMWWDDILLFTLIIIILVVSVCFVIYTIVMDEPSNDVIIGDSMIPIEEGWKLDWRFPYIVTETDDGLSVTVYFERVESDVE